MNDNKTPYTSHYMIEFSHAMQLIQQTSSSVKSESIELNKALGRVLSQSIHSIATVPPFDNSAMDGFAVNYADLQNANSDSPVTLKLMGLTAAGESHQATGSTIGRAWKIMTGAPVPEGFDAIIPVENTQAHDDQIRCFGSPKSNEHIRKSGEDFIQNSPIASTNTIVNANLIMALSAQGIAQVEVFKKISVALFSTGKELVDNPNIALAPGQIRNSNKPFILDWCQHLPVSIYDAGTNGDDVAKFENDLQQELDKNTQIIISSGAVSMGDFDFIPQTIKKLGGEIIFHKIKIKPGKPILFAKFPNGSYYFGLPGNPISATIGLRFFVSALILQLLGLPAEKPINAIINNQHVKKLGFRSILKANAQVNEFAQFKVDILEGQESFKIKALLAANGWGMIDEVRESVAIGDLIQFYPSALNWN